MQHVQNIQYVYLLNKYLKCSVWRLALRYDIYIYMLLSFKRLMSISQWHSICAPVTAQAYTKSAYCVAVSLQHCN